MNCCGGCFWSLKNNKASGIDQVTKEQYAENLLENLDDLVERLHRMAYIPQPVRRIYISKPGSDKKRPLALRLKFCRYSNLLHYMIQIKWSVDYSENHGTLAIIIVLILKCGSEHLCFKQALNDMSVKFFFMHSKLVWQVRISEENKGEMVTMHQCDVTKQGSPD